MKYKVILGFYSTAEKKRYRVGDTYQSKDKDRIESLLEQKLIVPVEEETTGGKSDGNAGKREKGSANKPE